MNRHFMKFGCPQARLSANQQAGFTLLEILVAIVVLSLGLLGLAGLQAASLRNNQVAYYRGIAAQQAYDMADRIRANLAGVAAGNYDNLTAVTPADPACFNADAGHAGCSAANMAVTDHSQWNSNNGRLLPAGVGTVDCVLGPGAACSNNPNEIRTFDITVQWTEQTAVGNVTQSFVTRVTP
jgi:type IV pilus assembly protein PilV